MSRGRPKKPNGKTRGVRVRMTEEDFLLLGIIARECGVTKTQILMEGYYGLLRRFGNGDLVLFNEKLQVELKRLAIKTPTIVNLNKKGEKTYGVV